MVTVIVGTNRKDNESQYFAKHLTQLLSQKSKEEIKYLDLAAIPHGWFHNEMYVAEKQSESLAAIQNDCILPAKKLIFVIPEYNGGFPGVVKLFIDACSIREYAQNFKGKKVAIIGTAAGRAGNLRGMEHLTGVLNYLGAHVLPNRLPISSINSLMNEKKEIVDKGCLEVIESFVDEVIDF